MVRMASVKRKDAVSEIFWYLAPEVIDIRFCNTANALQWGKTDAYKRVSGRIRGRLVDTLISSLFLFGSFLLFFLKFRHELYKRKRCLQVCMGLCRRGLWQWVHWGSLCIDVQGTKLWEEVFQLSTPVHPLLLLSSSSFLFFGSPSLN